MEKYLKHFDKYHPLSDKEKEALTIRLTERKINRISIIILLSICFSMITMKPIHGQVSNDDCTTAIDLDSVWNYINGNNCWNGLPSDTTIIDSTNNALVNFPYPMYPLPCYGYTSVIGPPSNDIWFKVPFVYGCDLIIGTSTSDTMHLVVWFGDSCNYLAYAACFTLVPGDTFVTMSGNGYTSTYFQISGNGPNSFTTFSMCLQTNAWCIQLPITGLPTPFVCMDYQTSYTDASTSSANDGSIVITILDGNPPYTIQWNDGGTGFIRNNLAPGSYVYNITDAVGCVTTDTIIVGSATFLADDVHAGLIISPNPVTDILHITGKADEEIFITNSLGKQVFSNIRISRLDSSVSIDVSLLPSGIYLIKFGNRAYRFLKI